MVGHGGKKKKKSWRFVSWGALKEGDVTEEEEEEEEKTAAERETATAAADDDKVGRGATKNTCALLTETSQIF